MCLPFSCDIATAGIGMIAMEDWVRFLVRFLVEIIAFIIILSIYGDLRVSFTLPVSCCANTSVSGFAKPEVSCGTSTERPK